MKVFQRTTMVFGRNWLAEEHTLIFIIVSKPVWVYSQKGKSGWAVCDWYVSGEGLSRCKHGVNIETKCHPWDFSPNLNVIVTQL